MNEHHNEQFNHNFDLEDWDIVALFKDTIWAEFIDEVGHDSISRGGIHIPTTVNNLKDFYRIAKVLKAGPDCSESVMPGAYLLIPPIMGMKGLKKGPSGGSSLFIAEDKVMAVINPKSQEAVENKKKLA